MRAHKEHPWLTAGLLVGMAMLWGFFAMGFETFLR